MMLRKIAGLVVLGIFLPVMALAAPTKQELEAKAQLHKARNGQSPKSSAKDAQAQQARHDQVRALNAQKKALMLERRTLAMQNDKAGMNANRQKIATVNSSLNAARKGGNKR